MKKIFTCEQKHVDKTKGPEKQWRRFIVSGEISGDKLGAWYLKRLQKNNSDIECHAVGGYFLKGQGAKLYETIEKLNIVGVIEVLKRLPFILKFLKQLAGHILKNNFDEVILVDFPGFNLRLAKRLKKANSKLKITYLSPPQVWIWGQWRVKKLKKYCDKLIVLYPFEVEWYKKRGIEVEFWGNPVCSELKPYFQKSSDALIEMRKNANQIAILPASRNSEVKKLFPIFAQIVKKIKMVHPTVKIVLPLAESMPASLIETKLKKFGLWKWGSDIVIVQGEKEKLEALNKCCLVITKPGTVTLQLALLGIPAVVLYKTSWITYFLAKLVVNIKFMSLPNLLLPKPVYKEFIQADCKVDPIFKCASDLYKKFILGGEEYKKQLNDLVQLRDILC